MGRIRKLRKEHYEKISKTIVKLKILVDNEQFHIPVWKASLPPGIWGTVLNVDGKKSIIISSRLRSLKSIIETVKHEFVHIYMKSNRHNIEFKNHCIAMGMDPKNHV